jgi:peptide deformylase
MTIYDILTLPNKILREKSEPIKNIDEEIKAILNNMAETMYAAPGIGLAAVQVGIKKRLVVMDCSREEDKKELIKLINPEIISKSNEKSIYEEGCLSIPDFSEEVERFSTCIVEYIDINGKKQILECDDLMATCVQHEIDHLNGKLFIDHISRLKREKITRKFIKLSKQKLTK